MGRKKKSETYTEITDETKEPKDPSEAIEAEERIDVDFLKECLPYVIRTLMMTPTMMKSILNLNTQFQRLGETGEHSSELICTAIDRLFKIGNFKEDNQKFIEELLKHV